MIRDECVFCGKELEDFNHVLGHHNNVHSTQRFDPLWYKESEQTTNKDSNQTTNWDQCDGCRGDIDLEGSYWYPLIIDLPQNRDSCIGEFCRDCAKTLARGEFTLRVCSDSGEVGGVDS